MRKLLLSLLSLLIPAAALLAQGWDQAKYNEIESRIVAPTFPDKAFPITRYGARTTASARVNQTAINKAIAACSRAGGGRVVVPAGLWNTGAIRLQSNVNLVVEEEATLLFAFDPSLYPIVRTRWEGLDIMNYSPCIYASEAENIAISGRGTIDGNGSRETWWPWCGAPKFNFVPGQTSQSQAMPYMGRNQQYRQVDDQGNVLSNRNTLLWMSDNAIATAERIFGPGCGMRPQLISFYECANLLIEDVTLLRSPFWVIHPILSRNITVRRCRIINEGPNGDGCDPESCEEVLIEDCLFKTGDDCIAIKSGRNGDGRRTPRPSRNIIIRGCTMEDGHGGVVIGSEISAGVQDVFAENCKMDSPHLDRVLRIKTNTCRGGVTDGIYMRNVEVGQCREAVLRINLVYEPKEQSQRGFIPTVRNVYMEHVTCQKSRYGILLNGLEESSNIYNIHVSNCSFDGVQSEPVRRTGLSHDVHFDNLYINGQLTLSQPPYAHYSEWLTASEMQRVDKPYYLDFTDVKKRPDGKWSYVMGIELEGMLDTYLTYRNPEVLAYIRQYAEKMIDAEGNITGYSLKDYNLDNIRPGRFIYRMNTLFPECRTPGTEQAVRTLFSQLYGNGRNIGRFVEYRKKNYKEQPRTRDKVWWHKEIYHWQVWLDGIYMGLPFYTMSAQEMVGPKMVDKVYDDALNQITTTFHRTYDAQTGLWKHAWDETHSMFWANPETGLSQHTWARAMGWFTMAMVEILDVLPEDYPRRAELIGMFGKAMAAVVQYQDPKTGVWYDVLDVNDPKNYLESTASSMFAYCLLKGARLGYLDASYKAAGVKAYEGIIRNFIRVNSDQTISLTNCCAVSGLGPEKSPNRDGSFEYYMSEPIRDNDAKGIGPFIWASLEMERDGYKTFSE